MPNYSEYREKHKFSEKNFSFIIFLIICKIFNNFIVDFWKLTPIFMPIIEKGPLPSFWWTPSTEPHKFQQLRSRYRLAHLTLHKGWFFKLSEITFGMSGELWTCLDTLICAFFNIQWIIAPKQYAQPGLRIPDKIKCDNVSHYLPMRTMGKNPQGCEEMIFFSMFLVKMFPESAKFSSDIGVQLFRWVLPLK